MKKFLLMAVASGMALAAATPASAAIFIGVAVNGGAIATVATDGGSGNASYVANSGGYFFNVGATGFPTLAMPQLLTQSTNVQNQGGANAVIDVYITQNNLTSLNGGLLSTFTSNTIQGLTAQITSYVDAANGTFTGAVLQNANFNAPGVFSAGNAVNLTGPFSETVRYRLSFTGGNGSNFNGTANLTAVPEPATWAMMIAGFGLVGGVMRRRKTSVAFA